MIQLNAQNQLQLIGTSILNQIMQWFVAIVIVIVFLVAGVIVAKIINRLIIKLLEIIKLEEYMKEKKLNKALFGYTITRLITIIAKVYIVFAFLGAAATIINISFFSQIIMTILNYIPSLVQGIIIIVAALLIADYITSTMKKENKMPFAPQIGLIIQFLIAYIAVIIALPLILPNLGNSIQILSRILELLLTVIVIAFGLGFGLAIGLGLKDSIAKAAGKNQDLFDAMFGAIKKKR